MKIKKTIKNGYKVVRSVLFTAIAFIVVIFVGLYIVLSIPAVQKQIKEVGERELSYFLGSKVEIGSFSFAPFNEAIIGDAVIYTPSGEKCVRIETLGAGISLYDLIINRKIVITYAELIGLDAKIYQEKSDEPLNIQFIIDAFAPKDKTKPPTAFAFDIRNIVIRKSAASYDKRYIPDNNNPLQSIDFNHLRVRDLSADVAIPLLSNDSIKVDLRNLAFRIDDGPHIKHLSCKAEYDPKHMSIKDFMLRLENSQLHLADILLSYPSPSKVLTSYTADAPLSITIDDSWVTPSDLKCFFTPLQTITERYNVSSRVNLTPELLTLDILNITSISGKTSLSVSNVTAIPHDRYTFDSLSNLRYADITVGEIAVNIPRETGMRFGQVVQATEFGARHSQLLQDLGAIKINIYGKFSLASMQGKGAFEATTGVGSAKGEISTLRFPNTDFRKILADISISSLNIADILPKVPINQLTAQLNIESLIDEKSIFSGKLKTPDQIWNTINTLNLNTLIEDVEFNGETMGDIHLEADKTNSQLKVAFTAPDAPLGISFSTNITKYQGGYQCDLTAGLDNFRPGIFTNNTSLRSTVISGDAVANVYGSDLQTLQGEIELHNLNYLTGINDKSLSLNHLTIRSYNTTGTESTSNTSSHRLTTIESDWIKGEITTTGNVRTLIPGAKSMAQRIAPGLLRKNGHQTPSPTHAGDIQFAFTIDKEIANQPFISMPVTPIYPITIGGAMDLTKNTATLSVDAPYLQQGRDKLIRDTRADINIANDTARIDLHSTIPTKKGILDLYTDITAVNDGADINLHFNPITKGGFYGDLNLQASYIADINPTGKMAVLRMLPSRLYLNGAEWNVGKSEITYADKRVTVDNLIIGHQNQYISIHGVASESPDDMIITDLSDINLDYIFDTLNINYVSFGGVATGQAIASGVFSGQLDAHTQNLTVKDLSYNHCVLGDGRLYGDFDIKQGKVGISAKVNENNRHVADIDGGIWLNGRDSLSFAISAEKVRVDFLQTFMHAFASDVRGRASGKGLLYGTFKDIDLTGRFFADTISLKVDYTNVTYSAAGDSVILTPGKVAIPPMTLYDRNKNTVRMTGELTHRYFHEPSFHFDIRNADKLLVYDTNPKMNSVWYGCIYGSGSGMINGTPEIVEIIADMTTEKDSDFTFVLDDSLEAADYTFLSFTDSKKRRLEEMRLSQMDEEDAIVAAFNKKVQQQNASSTAFAMDIRATITPDVKLTMIMDPTAGDKIVARGGGPINITYSSVNDEMRMLGKYTLDEGKYNFTLQDLILKDFIIKPGSSVAFNGDPMDATLNIKAAYRVNTNITDLDQSFANDRDLNRTNVPVDAMLIVNGEMTNPEITFDIEFPTLNEEVSQKVRSIISSDDMMTRQIIYLLALNRFAPSEYMGNSNAGGEWASVASSTLSSQLQNILGQLTDKFTIAPSLHSDKGDFSDLEVDVALSSRLFNNRLLINGNLGYRDPSTSSTTFVGDFDIEYLLTRNGNLRLKAYNHFNDQNYYLKSALTTQGLGIIFKKEFDDLLPRKMKRKDGDRRQPKQSAKEPKTNTPIPIGLSRKVSK